MAGRLALFEDNWSKISQDIWILNAIKGYKIEFLENSTQQGQPRVGSSSTSDQALLNEEIQKMLTKGAISEIPLKENPLGFYFSLFLVPKKDEGKRPVINLKDLNAYVPPYHFKMEGLHTLRDILKEGDWITKVDLKDAYFTMTIHQSDRQFLLFSTGSQDFQFNCLPFGLSCAPWDYTKTLSQC
uniref:Reverse transcriptase domain-containing protein n=1 Tax=Amphimedon queenslandica TaxID=400682 RepID=A0A1X7VHI1_AMPQE